MFGVDADPDVNFVIYQSGDLDAIIANPGSASMSCNDPANNCGGERGTAGAVATPFVFDATSTVFVNDKVIQLNGKQSVVGRVMYLDG